MHSHLDVCIGWGLAMTFLVENSFDELYSNQAPAPELPQC